MKCMNYKKISDQISPKVFAVRKRGLGKKKKILLLKIVILLLMVQFKGK